MILDFIKKYKFTIIWSIIILILVLIPSNSVRKPGFIIENLDKIVHFSMFVILSYFVQIENKAQNNISILSLIFLITFSISTELFQLFFTTTRKFDLIDIFADLGGIPIGILIAEIKNKLKKL